MEVQIFNNGNDAALEEGQPDWFASAGPAQGGSDLWAVPQPQSESALEDPKSYRPAREADPDPVPQPQSESALEDPKSHREASGYLNAWPSPPDETNPEERY